LNPLIFELDNFSRDHKENCLSPFAIFTHDNVFYRGYFVGFTPRPLTFSAEEVLYVPQQATLIGYDVHTFFL
jgi:hypothetical protein